MRRDALTDVTSRVSDFTGARAAAIVVVETGCVAEQAVPVLRIVFQIAIFLNAVVVKMPGLPTVRFVSSDSRGMLTYETMVVLHRTVVHHFLKVRFKVVTLSVQGLL